MNEKCLKKPFLNIKFHIGKNKIEEIKISDVNEVNSKLLLFFEKFNICNQEMKNLVKNNIMNFIENEKNDNNVKIKISKEKGKNVENDKFTVQMKKPERNKIDEKKIVKKDLEYFLNKNKNRFCRRKSGIEILQLNLKNKLNKKILNNTNLENKLEKKLNSYVETNSTKTTAKNSLTKNKLKVSSKIKINQFDTMQMKTTKNISFKRFHSLSNESPLKQNRNKKLEFDEADLNWLGTFENQESQEFNIYDKDRIPTIKTSRRHVNKNPKKLDNSTEVLPSNHLETPNFPNKNHYSKIKKRGSIIQKNSTKNFLFKILSIEELKNIFNLLDQKETGLIGAKNLNLRKVSSKHLQMMENVFLHFYNNPNLLFDFNDFIFQCQMLIKF